ncbi:MAG: HU family DNA-binding protein [Tannerella sp.]|jgi:predicted histone-like DNA-binding protein|nr:HU family DNA-binding protein [Tannerella sp.]
MAIKYDFYQTPSLNPKEGKPKLHPRIVSGHTVNTDKLARLIEQASSLTEGDAKAALNAFCRIMTSELQAGNRVHLEGLGYFHLTLTGPAVESEKEIRAESIKVKSIAFRPEIGLKKQLRAAIIKREKRKNHSQQLSEAETDKILTDYFKENLYITRKKFQQLCMLTESTANRRFKKLLQDGKLKISLHHPYLFEWCK